MTTPQFRQRRRILVIGEAPTSSGVIQASLDQDLFEVSATGSCEQAIELARNERPDLIILDLTVFNLEGCAAFRDLREKSETQDIPILLLVTERGDAKAIERWMTRIDGCLEKPLERDTFPLFVAAMIHFAYTPDQPPPAKVAACSSSGGVVSYPTRRQKGAIVKIDDPAPKAGHLIDARALFNEQRSKKKGR